MLFGESFHEIETEEPKVHVEPPYLIEKRIRLRNKTQRGSTARTNAQHARTHARTHTHTHTHNTHTHTHNTHTHTQHTHTHTTHTHAHNTR